MARVLIIGCALTSEIGQMPMVVVHFLISMCQLKWWTRSETKIPDG